MKIKLLIFLWMGIVLSGRAQQNQKKIDYQYLRFENNYVAYTVSVDTISNQIFFELVTDWPVKRFHKIVVYHKDELLMEHNGEALPILRQKDDERLRVFNFQLDGIHFSRKNFECNLSIHFISKLKKHNVTLPLDYCLLKKHIGN